MNHDKRLVGIVTVADLGRVGESAASKALEGISEPAQSRRGRLERKIQERYGDRVGKT